MVIDSAPFALSLTQAIERKIAYSILVAKDKTAYKAQSYGQKKAFDEKAPFKWFIRDHCSMAAVDLKGSLLLWQPFFF